jgi:hypothetical protein
MYDFIKGLVLMILVALAFWLAISVGYDRGYKACAHDFYEGKVKVDLVELPNGEKRWILSDED